MPTRATREHLHGKTFAKETLFLRTHAGPTCDADMRKKEGRNEPMRVLTGPTCEADTRNEGEICTVRCSQRKRSSCACTQVPPAMPTCARQRGEIDKTRVSQLRPWRMLASPTRDADMRPGEESGRERRLARGNRPLPRSTAGNGCSHVGSSDAVLLAQETEESAVAVLRPDCKSKLCSNQTE